MNNKVVIAHASMNEEELRKIKKMAKETFPGATVIAFNYYELPVKNEVVNDVVAIIVSGFGRVIAEGGVELVRMARRNKIPVYFVIKLNNDGLDDYGARLWAYRYAKSIHVEKPLIAELKVDDERRASFRGKPAIILPTYAM